MKTFNPRKAGAPPAQDEPSFRELMEDTDSRRATNDLPASADHHHPAASFHGAPRNGQLVRRGR